MRFRGNLNAFERSSKSLRTPGLWNYLYWSSTYYQDLKIFETLILWAASQDPSALFRMDNTFVNPLTVLLFFFFCCQDEIHTIFRFLEHLIHFEQLVKINLHSWEWASILWTHWLCYILFFFAVRMKSISHLDFWNTWYILGS